MDSTPASSHVVSSPDSRKRKDNDLAQRVRSCVQSGRLRVRVLPGARTTEVQDIKDSVVHVAVAAQPQDGKANAALERYLTRLLRCKLIVKTGLTARDKTLLLIDTRQFSQA